ncbi:protein SEC13 homolog isoform X2 [Gordionus sp. m RMFG-2023]|uniref:protein SEC13 homolog isoform X2 n=1 Tax=Gordionus sp. m RMFG-2023 TaxID=3053472 RepID=UPI0031FCAC2D
MITVANTIETSHEDMLHDAQLNLFGTQLATCSSDCTIKIFEILNGTQKYKATLLGHAGPVWQISWAHPSFGHILASCSYDKKVIIWMEIEDKWHNVYEHEQHKSSVNSISWAPYLSGLKLSCASSDGNISIMTALNSECDKWNIQIIENAHQELGCNAVNWSPLIYNRSIYTSDEKEELNKSNPLLLLVSGGCDNIVRIWKESDGKWEENCVLESHTDWVRDVAWAPSIGINEQTIATCSQDRKVIIWKNDNIDTKNWKSRILHTFEGAVWHLSWSITGSILAVSEGDNKQASRFR